MSCSLLLSCMFCTLQGTLAFSKDYGDVWSKAAGLSILFLLFIVFLALLSAGGSQCGAVSVATESAACFVGSANYENDFSLLWPQKYHLTHPAKCAASWPRWWMGETICRSQAVRCNVCFVSLWGCVCVYKAECCGYLCVFWRVCVPCGLLFPLILRNY